MKKVVNYICDEIYKIPEHYFNESYTNKENKKIIIKPPPKKIFKQFIMDILLKYSCFTSLNGYYRQKSGLSMGSKLSPIMANLYCHLMEKKLINNFIKTGEIVSWIRYVDDVYGIIKIGSKDKILNEINNFDKNYLKFTIAPMVDNSMSFLDTEIYIDDKCELQLKKYRKPTNSDVILNFKHAVTPKKYKLSCLKGDIFRCHYTTTTNSNRKQALVELSDLYQKNQYPTGLISKCIQEIKDRNFQPKTNKNEYNELVKKYPFRFYTLCISYTSNRCDKVMSKIFRLIKTHTPDYRLNVAWRNEKLARFYSHRLKLSTPNFEKIGTTYEFTCKCKISYLGETRRQLISRIHEHNRPSSNSAISDHIYGNTVKKINPCIEYNNELKLLHGDKPSP